MLGIVALIVYQLIDIGWREVLRSLPTHPMFYVLFVIMFLDLPVSEIFIYRLVWPFRKWEGFKAFITKRVYNQEVIGYAGEFYLFLWGRKQAKKPDKEIFKNIRDNSILSSISSNLVAIVLIGLLLYTGVIGAGDILGNHNTVYFIAAVILFIAAIALVVQFRNYLFDLPLQKAAICFSIYLSRFLFHHAILVLQWLIVLPDSPLSMLFLLMAIYIIVNRIPFIPSKDLVFMWAGIEFSRVLDVTTASIAGMLLVTSALKKVTNLTLFLLISYYSKDSDIQKAARPE